ncbi:FadR/GntR family transcriptional regulator [Paraburkholderia caffeinilytica]|uniref:FadR/GntR family transcriptional regulator n=1 Tax=Paraburkholderia caffeinilytica TaxID=1761016 RepID=UPI003D9FC4C8
MDTAQRLKKPGVTASRDKSEAANTLAPHTPVQTRRAFEEVALQIRSQLSSGKLRPGDRLPAERDLAEQFGLSRNTVREALRTLEISGVLEFRKGTTGGAFVREGQGDGVVTGIADLYRLGTLGHEHLTEARMVVALATTRATCERGSQMDLDALVNNVRAAETAVKAGNIGERVSINLEFFRILANASRNPLLIILTDAMIEIQVLLLEVLTPAPSSTVMASRRRLLKHLLARDTERAISEMEVHLKALEHHYVSQRRNAPAGATQSGAWQRIRRQT